MIDPRALQDWIAGVVREASAGTAVAIVEPIGAETGLLAPEADAMAKANPKRRREFSAGRRAVRRAFAELGLPPVPVPVGRLREPLWPPGLSGSISHDGGVAIALVQRLQPEMPQFAIDFVANPLDPVFAEIAPMISHPSEPPAADPCDRLAAARLFAAKEAAIKLLSPRLQAPVGFADLRARAGPDGFRIEHIASGTGIRVGIHAPLGAVFALASSTRMRDIPE